MIQVHTYIDACTPECIDVTLRRFNSFKDAFIWRISDREAGHGYCLVAH